ELHRRALEVAERGDELLRRLPAEELHALAREAPHALAQSLRAELGRQARELPEAVKAAGGRQAVVVVFGHVLMEGARGSSGVWGFICACTHPRHRAGLNPWVAAVPTRGARPLALLPT